MKRVDGTRLCSAARKSYSVNMLVLIRFGKFSRGLTKVCISLLVILNSYGMKMASQSAHQNPNTHRSARDNVHVDVSVAINISFSCLC